MGSTQEYELRVFCDTRNMRESEVGFSSMSLADSPETNHLSSALINSVAMLTKPHRKLLARVENTPRASRTEGTGPRQLHLAEQDVGCRTEAATLG